MQELRPLWHRWAPAHWPAKWNTNSPAFTRAHTCIRGNNVSIYIYMYTYVNTERERETHTQYIYIYILVYNIVHNYINNIISYTIHRFSTWLNPVMVFPTCASRFRMDSRKMMTAVKATQAMMARPSHRFTYWHLDHERWLVKDWWKIVQILRVMGLHV